MPTSPLTAALLNSQNADPTAMMITPQMQLAQSLLQQGTETSPIRSPWQGVARLAQVLAGRKIENDTMKGAAGAYGQAAADAAKTVPEGSALYKALMSNNALVRSQALQVYNKGLLQLSEPRDLSPTQQAVVPGAANPVATNSNPMSSEGQLGADLSKNPSYQNLLASLAGAKKGAETNAQNQSDLNFKPAIAGQTALAEVPGKTAQAAGAAQATAPFESGGILTINGREYPISKATLAQVQGMLPGIGATQSPPPSQPQPKIPPVVNTMAPTMQPTVPAPNPPPGAAPAPQVVLGKSPEETAAQTKTGEANATLMASAPEKIQQLANVKDGFQGMLRAAQGLKTGPLTEKAAGFNSYMQQLFGKDAPQIGAGANPDQVQQVQGRAVQLQLEQLKSILQGTGGRLLKTEFDKWESALPDASKNPQAFNEIALQGLGAADWATQAMTGLQQNKAQPAFDPQSFLSDYYANNPIRNHVLQASAATGLPVRLTDPSEAKLLGQYKPGAQFIIPSGPNAGKFGVAPGPVQNPGAGP